MPSGNAPSESKATQMIFCDMGVGNKDGQFSVYDAIIRKLIAQGIPAQEIASIGDDDTDLKKARLFDKVRSGDVRVAARQHPENGHRHQRAEAARCPAPPGCPVEARRSRAARGPHPTPGQPARRSGDLPLRHRRHLRRLYVADLETKAEFIAQVMNGDMSIRRVEDMDEQTLSYAEVKAIASGNPAVLTLAKIDMEAQRLTQLSRAHRNEQYRHAPDHPPDGRCRTCLCWKPGRPELLGTWPPSPPTAA